MGPPDACRLVLCSVTLFVPRRSRLCLLAGHLLQETEAEREPSIPTGAELGRGGERHASPEMPQEQHGAASLWRFFCWWGGGGFPPSSDLLFTMSPAPVAGGGASYICTSGRFLLPPASARLQARCWSGRRCRHPPPRAAVGLSRLACVAPQNATSHLSLAARQSLRIRRIDVTPGAVITRLRTKRIWSGGIS